LERSAVLSGLHVRAWPLPSAQSSDVERARHTEAGSSARSTGVASNHAMQASTKKESMETYRQFRGRVTARDFPYVVNSDNF
jgi:hypothetical protein